MRWLERDAVARVIVGLAAAVVYLNTIPLGFVYDDHLIIVENPIVREPRYLLHSFTVDYWRRAAGDLLYRPLTVFSFGLNHLAHGMRPAGFHAVNVALHVAVTLLVLTITRRLHAHATLAFAAALLFAVHPIHTEAVASIVGRGELLASLFALLAVWFSLRAGEGESAWHRRRFWACMGCTLAACLSKENGIVTPALIFLAEVTTRRERFRPPHLYPALLRYATLGAVVCLYLLVRYLVLGELSFAQRLSGGSATFPGLLFGLPWHLQFANALGVFGRYLGLLFFPGRLSADYSYNQIPVHDSIGQPEFLLGAVALGLLVALAGRSARRAPAMAFGIAFFLIAFLPASNFLIPIATLMAERTMYLPSVGFVIVAGWLFQNGLANVRSAPRFFTAALLVFVTLAFSVRTVVRNRDWRDEVSLFASAVAASPASAKAHDALGNALVEAGRPGESLVHYEGALAIEPGNGLYHYHLAEVLRALGREEEAYTLFAEAARLHPGLLPAHERLAGRAVARHDWNAARRSYQQAIALQPERGVHYFNLAFVLQQQGHLREARWQYREAVARNPHDPSYVFNLGVVSQQLGDIAGAVDCYEQATQRDAANEKYRLALADAALKAGDATRATRALEEIVRVSTNAAHVARARAALAAIRGESR